MLLLLVAAIGSAAVQNGMAADPPPSGPALLSAAASTKDLMESLAQQYTKGSKGTIKVNPGSSNSLAGQIIAGAPADLFLSASEEWADKVQTAKLATQQVKFLTNKLVLIVPKGNPAAVKNPNDLVNMSVHKIALAGEKVPAGRYADQALTKLGLLDSLVQEKKIVRGQDVRTALAFVERGEAEAGIVYSTDLLVAKKIELVHEFDPALHDKIVYVLMLLRHGKDNSTATGFFEFLNSKKADEAIAKFGFERLSDDSQKYKTKD